MNKDPKKTGAIVIGVENYEAGQSWDLNGPADDACKFATWLCDRQVPPENITLFLSPLAKNLALPNGLSFQAATEENVNDWIKNTLTQSTYDLLYFYWGGHGVMTTDQDRRLFYADATEKNKENLDLNALLTVLRTDYFRASTLSRQIFIVDTCANYVEKMGWAKDLPHSSFSNGKPLDNREQYVLMAAKPGELATNKDAEKTGLFTKELMAQLTEQPNHEWPPNMDMVLKGLKQRFVELREAGKAEQTPTRSYYRDWNSNEGTFILPKLSEEDWYELCGGLKQENQKLEDFINNVSSKLTSDERKKIKEIKQGLRKLQKFCKDLDEFKRIRINKEWLVEDALKAIEEQKNQIS
jgi:hypothetical protein